MLILLNNFSVIGFVGGIFAPFFTLTGVIERAVEKQSGSKNLRRVLWMRDNCDYVPVPPEDAKLLIELHQASDRGNSVDDLKYDKKLQAWVYYENVKKRKTIK